MLGVFQPDAVAVLAVGGVVGLAVVVLGCLPSVAFTPSSTHCTGVLQLGDDVVLVGVSLGVVVVGVVCVDAVVWLVVVVVATTGDAVSFPLCAATSISMINAATHRPMTSWRVVGNGAGAASAPG